MFVASTFIFLLAATQVPLSLGSWEECLDLTDSIAISELEISNTNWDPSSLKQLYDDIFYGFQNCTHQDYWSSFRCMIERGDDIKRLLKGSKESLESYLNVLRNAMGLYGRLRKCFSPSRYTHSSIRGPSFLHRDSVQQEGGPCWELSDALSQAELLVSKNLRFFPDVISNFTKSVRPCISTDKFPFVIATCITSVFDIFDNILDASHFILQAPSDFNDMVRWIPDRYERCSDSFKPNTS